MNAPKSPSQKIDQHHGIPYIAANSDTTASPAKIGVIHNRKEIERVENATPEMTGCLTIDHKARIQSFDANCELLFGFKPSEVINRNVSLLMPEFYALEHDAYLTRYLCGGEPRIIGCGCEIIAQRKDGLIFPIWLTVHEDSTTEQLRFIGHMTAINA